MSSKKEVEQAKEVGQEFGSLRRILPGFDAAMLDIDLEKLEEERFGSKHHWELMVAHDRRHQEYKARLRWQKFEGHLDEVGEMWRKKEQVRRARIAEKRNFDRYTFSDDVLDIAIRSLNARDSM